MNDIRAVEFLIKDPRTRRKVEVKSAAERNIVLNTMRKGATLEQAAKIAKNASVTPDGLASVTSSRTPTTSPSPSQAANNRVRSQIADSVRDYLLKTGGFLPSDALGWSSTGP